MTRTPRLREKLLARQAAFGPKIGQGEPDPESPGARLAAFPVKHKRGMERAMLVGLAVEGGRPGFRGNMPAPQRLEQVVEGAKERALGGLVGEAIKRTKRLRQDYQAEKTAKKRR